MGTMGSTWRWHLRRALLGLLAWHALTAAAVHAEETTAPERIQYQRLSEIAGDPLDSVRFFRVHYWQPVGERALVLWLGREEPYLIDLRERCFGLRQELFLRVGDYQRPGRNLLRTRWSQFVMREGRSCRVGNIRALDYARLGAIDPRVMPPAGASDSKDSPATDRRNWVELEAIATSPPAYPTGQFGPAPQGTAHVAAEVDSEGRVVSTELLVSCGADRFDQAALAAVKSWRFAAPHNADSDRVWVDVPITFTME